MIRFREEGGVVRQGFNIYPRHSGSVGFLFRLGRMRLMARYSKANGWAECCVWRQETPDVSPDI